MNMNFDNLYRITSEKRLEQAGIKLSHYERTCKEYVDILDMRREAMRSGDFDMFHYAFSASVDKQKHIAHNRCCETVSLLNAKCVELGCDPIFAGDIHNRQQVGQFACLFSGEPELAMFAD